MGSNNTGFASCKHCGAEFRLFTIFNRDMQALCKIWKRRHEHACYAKTPAQRRTWAKKFVGKDEMASSLTVDINHAGFIESILEKQDDHKLKD